MLRALTRMAALRCAAFLLVAVALGTELDLREITARLQDATLTQAVTFHCGARDRAQPRRHGSPGAPTGGTLLAAALSLPAPLVMAPPALAPPAAFAAVDPTGRTLAWALPPPSPRSHRSRAPPAGV